MFAEELGLPDAGTRLQWRGNSRAELGDPDGLDDMRRALELALEQGQGRVTAVSYANLAITRWLYKGPTAALTTAQETTEFSERRGNTDIALQIAGIAQVLAELGRADEALAERWTTADRSEATGSMAFTPSRGDQMRLLAERGAPTKRPTPTTSSESPAQSGTRK